MENETAADEKGCTMVIFRDMADGLTRLKAESRHRIMDAVLDWFTGRENTLEASSIDPTEALVVEMMKSKQLSYAEVCLKRRKAGERGGRSRSRLLGFASAKSSSMSSSKSSSKSMSMSVSTSKSTSKMKRQCRAFVPPTLEEVSEYCRVRGGTVDAQAWYDYYSSNGWRVGRAAMKDWQAAVRTWERRKTEAPFGNTRHAANWRGTNTEDLSNAF